MTDRWADIYNCRVTFATENIIIENIEISVAMKCNFLKDVEISKISIFVRKHA